jgi:ABC-type transporter Mla subunit MlaD
MSARLRRNYTPAQMLRRINDMTNKINELVKSHNDLLAKLDDSTDLSDSDFVSTLESDEVVEG